MAPQNVSYFICTCWILLMSVCFFLKQEDSNKWYLITNLDSIFKFSADSHIYMYKIYRQSKNQDVEGWEVNVRKFSGILNKSIKQILWEVFISQQFQESVPEFAHKYHLGFLTHTFMCLQKIHACKISIPGLLFVKWFQRERYMKYGI